MADSILVAYATTYGSTQEVSEAIASTLRENGLNVICRNMKQVGRLDDYRAVVLGAPLYMFHLHKDAQAFLARNRGALESRPVAFFVLGPAGKPEDQDQKEWQEIRASLEKEMALYPWLKPVALELFGGKLDPSRLRFPMSLLLKLPASPLRNAPAVDLRDWSTIRAWAAGLAEKL